MKDIENYEGLYAVTPEGDVWSYRRKKFLKPATDKDGYYKYRSLKEIGIDLERQKSAISGKSQKKVNKYLQLQQRAERARQLAKKQIAKRKGGN